MKEEDDFPHSASTPQQELWLQRRLADQDEELAMLVHHLGTQHPDSAAAVLMRARFDAFLALRAGQAAASLGRATWALVACTAVLAVATVALIFATLAA